MKRVLIVFDLHAHITVAADDRSGVERLCRYVLRPPVAPERLALSPMDSSSSS